MKDFFISIKGFYAESYDQIAPAWISKKADFFFKISHRQEIPSKSLKSLANAFPENKGVETVQWTGLYKLNEKDNTHGLCLLVPVFLVVFLVVVICKLGPPPDPTGCGHLHSLWFGLKWWRSIHRPSFCIEGSCWSSGLTPSAQRLAHCNLSFKWMIPFAIWRPITSLCGWFQTGRTQ